MEIGQLYQGLTFLAYATGFIVLLVGIMFFKVGYDISKLSTVSGTIMKGFFGGLCAGLKIFGKKK